MRISDWSSDVSSSDLAKIKLLPLVTFGNAAAAYYPGIDRHFTIQYVKTTCQNQVLRVIVFIDLQNIVARYQGLHGKVWKFQPVIRVLLVSIEGALIVP